MGKVKHLMHSLRSRFMPSKSKITENSPHSSASTSSGSSTWVDDHDRSTTTVQSAPSEAQTLPTTPSKSPPSSTYMNAARHTSESSEEALSGEGDLAEGIDADSRESYMDARTELRTSIAMLNFAKRLPLEELSMIGCGSAILSLSANGQVSSGEDTTTHRLEILDANSPLRTQSLTSASSESSWSFACQSARRVERNHKEVDGNSDASSFGSLVGWGVTDCGKVVDEERHDSPEEDYDDCGGIAVRHSFDHPHRNTYYRPRPPCVSKHDMVVYQVRQAHIRVPGVSLVEDGPGSLPSSPVTRLDLAAPPAFAEVPRYIGTPTAEILHPKMSDEEFAMLPDWSDVEDDAEYNTFSMEPPVSWSLRASPSPSQTLMEERAMKAPAVYVPSGYPGCSHTNGMTTVTEVKTRLQLAVQEVNIRGGSTW